MNNHKKSLFLADEKNILALCPPYGQLIHGRKAL